MEKSLSFNNPFWSANHAAACRLIAVKCNSGGSPIAKVDRLCRFIAANGLQKLINFEKEHKQAKKVVRHALIMGDTLDQKGNMIHSH